MGWTLVGLRKAASDGWNAIADEAKKVETAVVDEAKKVETAVVDEAKQKARVATDPELTADRWKEVIAQFREIVRHHTAKPFPQDVHEQLELAGAAHDRLHELLRQRAPDARR